MDKLDFCPNCGGKLETGDEFCPNCGFDLKKYLQEDNSKDKPVDDKKIEDKSVKKPIVSQPIKKQEPVETKQMDTKNVNEVPVATDKPMPNNEKKKSNKLILSIVILIIIIVAGYFGGKTYYSESRQIQTLQDNVISGTSSKMKSSLIDVNGNKLSTSQIGALKRLYLKDSSAIKSVGHQIKDNRNNTIVGIKENGKILMIYPRYKVVLKNVILTVKTNISNPTFYLDGKIVAAKSVNGEYQIDTVTPGVYDLKVVAGKGSGKMKEQISVAVNNDQTNVTMNVKKPKKAKKKISKQVTKTKDDVDNDNSEESENSSSDNDDSNTSSDDESLIGKYSGDPDLALYSDGTYDLGDKTGNYKIIENNDGHVKIQFDQDDGGSITESYDYTDGELHSSKYDTSWYKE